MNQLYTLLIIPVFLFQHTVTAQTFVKHDATGANDGSSWADAFTDLNDALNSANDGDQIWVASGIYTPGGNNPVPSSVFRVKKAVSIYGGFTGTESSLDERDPAANLTTLNGDINGDDIPNDFSTNRFDNAIHIVYVDSLLNGTVTIDGFQFKGGHTGNDNTQAGYFWQGGAIHSQHTVNIRHCSFTGNFARTGGCIYLSNKCSGSEITDCSFTQNSGSSQSAGIFLDNNSETVVKRCEFTGNQTTRGAFYAYFCFDVMVDSCTFSGNVNLSGAGGAFYNFNSVGLILSNSSFQNNVAVNSGALYYDADQLQFTSSENFLVQNCEFIDNNNTAGVGGAFRNFQGSYTLEDCYFENNTSTGSGGHIRNDTNGDNVVYQNCTFKNGNSGGWGGAHTCYGTGNYTITACTYLNNSTTNLGGVANIGFGAHVSFDNCTFENNESQNSSGGALSMQNDSTTLVVTNSTFNINKTQFSGGAIFSGASSSSSFLVVDACEFWANEANFGAAIHIGENGAPEATLDISNSIFGFNFAMTQGGAVNMVDVDATITSCLFMNNVADGTGTGGAISNNATDSNHVEVLLMNNTFADNFGLLAGGIANWTGENGASSTLTLQNNIFRQGGALNYAIEAGTPEAVSNGGNMSDDDSMTSILTHSSDLNGSEPDFVDPGDFNYQLADNSPGIDAGIDDGAPAFDLLGNPRINEVDMGAYENQNVTSAGEKLLENKGALRIAPNPAPKGRFTLNLENDWAGKLQVRIYNINGIHVWTTEISKQNRKLTEPMTLPLRPGVYQMLVTNGKEALVEKLVAF